MPFAREAAVIALRRQQFGQGDFVGQPVVAGDLGDRLLQPVVDADLRGCASCEQAGAGGRADGAGREGVGKAGPLGGEAIQVGRVQFVVAVTARRPGCVVVGEEEHDVGLGHGAILLFRCGNLPFMAKYLHGF